MLTACHDIVENKNKLLEACDATTQQVSQMYTDTKVHYDQAEDELQKIYRNPYVMVGLGITAGFVIDRLWSK